VGVLNDPPSCLVNIARFKALKICWNLKLRSIIGKQSNLFKLSNIYLLKIMRGKLNYFEHIEED